MNEDDLQLGQYLYSDGVAQEQPPMSRTPVLTVDAGQSVAFGVAFGSLSAGWYIAPYHVTTAYLCS